MSYPVRGQALYNQGCQRTPRSKHFPHLINTKKTDTNDRSYKAQLMNKKIQLPRIHIQDVARPKILLKQTYIEK